MEKSNYRSIFILPNLLDEQFLYDQTYTYFNEFFP